MNTEAAATKPSGGPPHEPLCLRLDEGGDDVAVVCLVDESVIGRDFRSDVVVHDDEASRMHARVTPIADGLWTIVDLATTNGTFVNSERIVGPALIRIGDVIRVGRATCTVVPPPIASGGDPVLSPR